MGRTSIEAMVLLWSVIAVNALGQDLEPSSATRSGDSSKSDFRPGTVDPAVRQYGIPSAADSPDVTALITRLQGGLESEQVDYVINSPLESKDLGVHEAVLERDRQLTI